MSDDRELLRAGLNAIHEAFGTPVTRCAQLNSLVRDYPETATETLMKQFLLAHDAGRCDCAEGAPSR